MHFNLIDLVWIRQAWKLRVLYSCCWETVRNESLMFKKMLWNLYSVVEYTFQSLFFLFETLEFLVHIFSFISQVHFNYLTRFYMASLKGTDVLGDLGINRMTLKCILKRNSMLWHRLNSSGWGYGPVTGTCVNTCEPLISTEGKEFLISWVAVISRRMLLHGVRVL